LLCKAESNRLDKTMLLWSDSERPVVHSFGIAGDFLPAARLVPAAGESWSSMAELALPVFRDLEFSLANLECPVGVEGLPAKIKPSLGGTFAAAGDVLDYLAALRVFAVGVANNHLFDYKRDGAERTCAALLERSFTPLGFGRALHNSPDILLYTFDGLQRVGLWAAARNVPDSATTLSTGIEPATIERAARVLSEMRACGTSCHVAFLHAGCEGTNFPDPEDVQFMDALATAGFDVVAACHSHRTSGYKTIRRRNGQVAHCFYGLGSLSSGVLYSALEHEGILAVVGLDASGAIACVEARPIFLDERGFGRSPVDDEGAVLLSRFQELSRRVADGSYRRAFYRDISKCLMKVQWNDVRVAFQRAGVRGVIEKLRRMRLTHFRRLYHKGLDAIGLR